MGSSEGPAAARPRATRLSHVPIRTCVACRRKSAKASLLRIAASGGTVEVGQWAPGRGAYVCPEAPCLEEALRRDGARLARALRRHPGQVTVDEAELAAAAAAHGERRREELST